MGVRRLRKGRVQGICSTHNVYLYEHCNKIICEMLLNKERTLPSRLSSPLSTTHEVLEGRTIWSSVPLLGLHILQYSLGCYWMSDSKDQILSLSHWHLGLSNCVLDKGEYLLQYGRLNSIPGPFSLDAHIDSQSQQSEVQTWSHIPRGESALLKPHFKMPEVESNS